MSFCNSLIFFIIWTSAKPQPISNVIWQSHGVHLVNINVYAKFHHNVPLSSRDGAIITFSEFAARQSFDQRKISFRNLLVYILSVWKFTQPFIKVFHSVYEIVGPFSLFQNLALGKASTDDICHLQFLELDLVSINVSAKFYQNIPNGLRLKFEPRQNLDQSQMSFDYLVGYIMSISMCMQNFIIIFHSVQEKGAFSLFQNLELGKASTDERCHFVISWARSC